MKRVLIVDDEHVVANTLAAIFRNSGFDARAVYSADEAMRCLTTFDPELLLCDISMPEKDGIQLMADVSRELPECRLLVLTGYHANILRITNQERLVRRPARILSKPCHPAELLREAVTLLAS